MSKSETIALLMHHGEAAFAEAGYNGTSMRDIAARAQLPLSSIHHYFVNKESLFLAVLKESFELVNRERIRMLDERRRDGRLTLETLIEAIVRPVVQPQLLTTGELPSYVRLMRQLGSIPSVVLVKLTRSYLDATALTFIQALQEIKPGLSAERAAYGYSFVIHGLYHTLAQAGRLARIAGTEDAIDLNRLIHDHSIFCIGGLSSISEA